ncbi:MAG TPA: septal ring lytic transglycosylase RlpA family protein [Rhodopila sp.]|uniref:septal ring lytic transglycosylase RlpA family protein n=1 Tax=Rhodopila sp. TaxID=2480087 RepID=UPI002C162CCA|nr:septal ring lytic transglycosylase RlpA family protein [Rhodopila sp.]HVY15064.1 septal ring lytic transglycosylase RlpA family protein [Rhodopila sp.]
MDTAAQREYAKVLNRLPAVPASRVVRIDHSGRKEKGRASYYARHFANRKMADGRPLNPNANIAASKQLPLGSVAKVTNLMNGRTVTVKVEDRGPYIVGRVIDLAPKAARALGMQQEGVVPVEVAPITVPNRDGVIMLGAGAADASPSEVQDALETTAALRGLPSPAQEEASR